MTMHVQPPVEQPAEQLFYARLLQWGTDAGLVVLVLSFAAYAGGLLTPLVPLERLPSLWSLPVDDYLRASGLHTGWGWLGQLPRADVTALLGIVLLAGCSVPALLALVPLYLQRRDFAFVVLCLAQVAVVLLAASGWLTGGH
jgi:hypothetical protein